MLRRTASVAIAMTILSAHVLADSPTDVDAADKLFGQLDANQDGQVTSDEVSADKRGLFDRLLRTADANSDQKLNAEEFRTGLREPVKQPVQLDAAGPSDRDRPLQRFRQWDTNGDGKVAMEEVPEPARPIFERALDQFDDNSDDALDFAELRKALPMILARFRDRESKRQGDPTNKEKNVLFERLDANHDGRLDRAELAAATSVLGGLDRDGDGSISREEASPAESDNQVAGKGFAPNADELIRRAMAADADGDGRLSKSEAPERLRDRFDRIDQNSDGFIDAAELRERMGAMAARLRERGKVEGVRKPEK